MKIRWVPILLSFLLASSAFALTTAEKKAMVTLGQGNSAEVDLARLVEPKATNGEVKEFAQQMIRDHSKGFEKLQSLARYEKVELKSGMDAEHKKFAARLAKEKIGLPYDRTYIAQMVKDHEKDLRDTRKARRQAKNLELQAWLDDQLATIQHHLSMANEIRGKLK